MCPPKTAKNTRAATVLISVDMVRALVGESELRWSQKWGHLLSIQQPVDAVRGCDGTLTATTELLLGAFLPSKV